MRKGFTRKPQEEPTGRVKNYITPNGLRRLKKITGFCSLGNVNQGVILKVTDV